MKIKLNANMLMNTIISGFIIFSIVFGVLFSYTSAPNTSSYSDNLPPIDAKISDSLSYRQYKNLKDSINEIRSFKNGEAFSGGGVGFNFLSTTSCLQCDTCSLRWIHQSNFDDHAHTQDYLKLTDWKIRAANQVTRDIDSVQFYAEHGQGYVRKLSARAGEKDASKPAMQTVDLPVKFRYDHREQRLMIPISPSVKQIWNIVLSVAGITMLIYGLYLLSCFLHFVLDLSKGLSFTNNNVRRLRVIALSLLIYPVAEILLNFLIRMAFNSYFTPEVVLNDDIWISSWKMAAIGIIFLVLYKAFRQGKRLKDEQELTV